MKKLSVLLSLLLLSLSASAVTDTARTVTSTGMQNGVAYITVSPATTSSCLYSVLYLPSLDTTAGKTMLAGLLAAASAEKPLSRMDYDVQGDGTCKLSLIQF